MERKKLTIGRVTIHSGRNRKTTDRMGRFGGGWQWKLGVTAGDWSPKYGRTILVALLTDEYRVQIHPKGATHE